MPTPTLNPYENATQETRPMPVRRGLRRYLAAGAIAIMLGGSVAIPGIVLLNQQYEWYPVNTYLYEFEIGGQSVAPESVARGLVTISVALLSIGILLCLIALRNFQFNKKLAQRIVMHSMTYVITFF